MSTIAEILKERRMAKGLSMRAVAEKAGISAVELSRIESGERIRSSTPILISLGEALGVSGDEILYLAGYTKNDMPSIEKVFPEMKTEKQRSTVKRIADCIAGDKDLKDSDYDGLAEQVEMFLDYARKKRKSLL